MLNLKIKNKEVEPTFSYGFYKNVAGKDREKRSDVFNEFLNGLFNDDSDSVVDFFKGSFGSALSEDEIVQQLEEKGAFDDVHALTGEIIKGLAESGFLRTKIEALKKYDDNMIKGFEKSSKMESIEKSDKDMLQIQIEALEEHKKTIDKRIKEATSEK